MIVSSTERRRTFNNLGEGIFRWVGCSSGLVPVGTIPDSNPNSDPDPKPQPKRAKTRRKRGCAAFASNQELSKLRTTIPKCRPRYAIFKSKTSLKIPSPRLLKVLFERRSLHWLCSASCTRRLQDTPSKLLKQCIELFIWKP